MKFKDIFIILVFLAVLVGVWFFIRMGETKPIDFIENKVEEGKMEIPLENKKVSENESKINSNIKDKINMQATLNTNKGNITIELFADKTPNTVENFAKLAKTDFYNGVKFHRVIKGFMIQGGDPLTKDDSKMDMWGTGGPGYKFADEIGADNRNDIGTISMANAGPNTNGSQFFINTAANNFLDGKHTVFGKVVSGMEVVKAIEASPTGAQDRPVEPIIINSITLK